jgi:S-DNA-T family DNA segregation ATPase FtsK/SpoIIIE
VVQTVRLTWRTPWLARFRGGLTATLGLCLLLSLATYAPSDPSWNTAAAGPAHNLLGGSGAVLADVALQSLGLAAWVAAGFLMLFGLTRATQADPDQGRWPLRVKALTGFAGVLMLAGLLCAPQPPKAWPLARGLGGFWGSAVFDGFTGALHFLHAPAAGVFAGLLLAGLALFAFFRALSIGWTELKTWGDWIAATALHLHETYASLRERAAAPAEEPALAAAPRRKPKPKAAAETAAEPAARPRRSYPPVFDEPEAAAADEAPAARVEPEADLDTDAEEAPPWEEPVAVREPDPEAGPRVADLKLPRNSGREDRENQGAFDFVRQPGFQLPELNMLAKPKVRSAMVDEASLRQNARMLESVLAEFGVRGQIDQIRPGPVVTLYELVPAPGVKSARVVALADDIARSMSARACRVSVVQGRNAIGIELPNARRETVYLRDLLSSSEFEKTGHILPLALGETIGGDPYIADLAKMPHLLIAGTTGSGKSVGVNAMILSILYRLPPEQCRFIMVDPKMLELSIYDGIPHLLAPVVTDPKKAVVALKWTVREMEDRYRRMSKIGVRNVASYNERAREALARGEHFERTVQTGFDETGKPVFESEEIRPEPMPYLVVIIDEMADLMLVAGKDIEGAVQRLAQMARAAGIHLVTATQRPSVDVITGTIKANFPTRISFQVTSKIDSRTILGEQGAEQLLGQGDMLYMAGGGRVTRLHGPFVSDGEVEAVVKYLREQGEPQYLEDVTAGGDEDEEGGEGGTWGEGGTSGDDLYDRAVAVVTRDRKASTSYIQRRLQIGYNRAASLMERMEREGIVGAANHAGKRDILVGPPP